MDLVALSVLDQPLTLNFSPRSIQDWVLLSQKAPNMNWFQSWPYATAIFNREKIPTRLATLEIGQKIVGFVALQEIKLGFITTVQIYRGPVWLENQNTLENFKKFCGAFVRLYPKSPWVRRRWLIETSINTNVSDIQTILAQHELTKKEGTFETSWINLQLTETELMQNLKAKFRNGLRKSLSNVKAQKIEIHVQKQISLKKLELFLSHYENYKSVKKFNGPSAAFMKYEMIEALKSGQALFICAEHQGQMIAGFYFLISGTNVAYRLGWNSNSGRLWQVHSSMMWRSIQHFQEAELHRFDLGGLLIVDEPELARFKIGLGGEIQSSLGVFG